MGVTFTPPNISPLLQVRCIVISINRYTVRRSLGLEPRESSVLSKHGCDWTDQIPISMSNGLKQNSLWHLSENPFDADLGTGVHSKAWILLIAIVSIFYRQHSSPSRASLNECLSQWEVCIPRPSKPGRRFRLTAWVNEVSRQSVNNHGFRYDVIG